MQKRYALLASLVASVFSGSAFAVAVEVDTAATVLQLAVINTTTAAIGAALLIAAAIAVTFKWAKATIFG
jgi:hypothetical protein